MITAFDLQRDARGELALFKCGLGSQHLEQAKTWAYESGYRGHHATTFVVDEDALLLAHGRGQAARLVKSITLHGSESRDMYDDHPGYAYFSSASYECVPVPTPMTLWDAMSVAELVWHESRLRNGLDDPDRNEYDGQFHPDKIVLVDGAGNVVQQFAGKSWESEFVSPDEWPVLLARAAELDAEGSEESRWDNFYSAARCHDRASNLRNRVAIAMAHHRAIGEMPVCRT